MPPSPPPPNILQDDPEGADAARQRLIPKKGFARLISKSSKLKLGKKSSVTCGNDLDTHDNFLHVPHGGPISLDCSAMISRDDSTDKDKFQWAVLYENQRGITAFSIPYYSCLSLLPTDPAPFTLPDPSLEPAHHPPVSPNTYPLPDGNWHWVSRAWMIDMRSDTGQVQHDGFEYNWIFRKHNWKSHVGPMNIAGYVRRRRWIRLMVRPATRQPHKGDATPISSPDSSPASASFNRPYRHSLSSSIPPSVMTGFTDLSLHSSSHGYFDPNEVWLGTNTDEDWDRCRRLMKHFNRDGQKLELWRLWLGFHQYNDLSEKAKGKRKQWTEDDELMASEATVASNLLLTKDNVTVVPCEYLIPVLGKYVRFFLHSFEYFAFNPVTRPNPFSISLSFQNLELSSSSFSA